MNRCVDPDCYNYSITNTTFCSDCLLIAVMNMEEDDLYEIFLEGDSKIIEAIQDGEAHGILSAQDKRLINKFKYRWFKLINNFMLKQKT